jgi:C4-dicarboxylate-specific signal transduction histidine kinase
VRLELEPAAPHVPGDRLQLQQAIMNLVTNAAEAVSEASATRDLTVRTRVDADGAVAVAVEDRGPGVDPEAAERLFDPFFTTKPNGMGMGLSIATSIAEAHGGRLSVSPGSVGGAVFQLLLPRR